METLERESVIMEREEEIVPEDEHESEPLVASTEKPLDDDASGAAEARAPLHRPTLFDPWGLVSVIAGVLIAVLVLKWATSSALKPVRSLSPFNSLLSFSLHFMCFSLEDLNGPICGMVSFCSKSL